MTWVRNNPALPITKDHGVLVVKSAFGFDDSRALTLVNTARMSQGDLEAVVGFIRLNDEYEQPAAYQVSSVWAEPGYGPRLYELALTWIHDRHRAKGRLLPDRTQTLPAQAVWTRFMTRPDVVVDVDEHGRPLAMHAAKLVPCMKALLCRGHLALKKAARKNRLRLAEAMDQVNETTEVLFVNAMMDYVEGLKR